MLFPIGIQSFEEIRNGGYVYVDKTAQIYGLAANGKYYFLSRPRRFGKSLLLSTMEAYFLGQKELFKGLAMEQLEKEWNIYPVLHLDLNQGNYQNPDELDKVSERCPLRMGTDIWLFPFGRDAGSAFCRNCEAGFCPDGPAGGDSD
jgi:hypothetical protein